MMLVLVSIQPELSQLLLLLKQPLLVLLLLLLAVLELAPVLLELHNCCC